ncbi:MAG: hypothetical protein ACTSU2_02840 [Promethearchaeota archaeon]
MYLPRPTEQVRGSLFRKISENIHRQGKIYKGYRRPIEGGRGGQRGDCRAGSEGVELMDDLMAVIACFSGKLYGV